MEPEEVCKRCRGWCCYRFNVILRHRKGRPDWKATLKENKYLNSEDVEKNVLFCKRHWKVEPRLPEIGGISMDPELRSFTFSCDCYDLEKGCCTKYDSRPPICRIYFCKSELPPTPDNQHNSHASVQARVMKEHGIDWKLLPEVSIA